MAPTQPADDGAIFLFHCLQTTGSKIDFNEVAINTGLTTAAARMRYVRLRDKILSKNPPAAHSASKSAASKTPSKSDKKLNLKGNGATHIASKKRKHAQVDLENESDDSKVHKQVKKESSPSARRQTRGKKIDFTHFLDDESSNVGSSYVDDPNNLNDETDDIAGENDLESGEAEVANEIDSEGSKTTSPEVAPRYSGEKSQSSTSQSDSNPHSDEAFASAHSTSDKLSTKVSVTAGNPWKNDSIDIGPNHVKNEFTGFRSGMMVHVSQIGNDEVSPSTTGGTAVQALPNYTALTSSGIPTTWSTRNNSEEVESTTSIQPNDSISSAGQNISTVEKVEVTTSTNS